MNFHILTLFPEMVMAGLSESITGRAIKDGKINIEATNIRDFSTNKHKKVDDYTYGGGAGMLMQAEPVYQAYKSVEDKLDSKPRVIYVTPQGHTFNQTMAKDFAKEDSLVILCGHYEGIDERVLEEVVTDYVSIGDYVLTGGELAAMIIVDAVSRFVPGVLHNDDSAETESFHGSLLEYPQYSRPPVWHDKEVPSVLMSGNQKKINDWRIEKSIERTRERRPDLYDEYNRLKACKEILLKEKLLNIDMIELINRGRARIVHLDESEILLQDEITKIYFHSLVGTNLSGGVSYEGILRDSELKAKINCLITHQRSVAEVVDIPLVTECYNAAYTPKEKMAVTGLYRPDGNPTDQGLVIKPISMECKEYVLRTYDSFDDSDYVIERIKAGTMVGAFIDDKLVGYAGTHGEGSMGLVFVEPEFRGRKIAMALETYLVNRELEQGHIPYGQITVENEASIKLQQKLGLYISKATLYWHEK